MPKNALLIAAALVAVSCAGQEGDVAHETGAAHEHEETGTLPEEIASLEIRNARLPAADLLTGGQLSRKQMEALHTLGYTRFISLRPADEEGAGWEEKFAAEEGLTFERIPVAGGAGVTVDNAKLLADALPAAGSDEKAVVYCASGNRVGALLALKAHFLDGRPADEALQFGLDAGLTRLEPVVRESLGLGEAGS